MLRMMNRRRAADRMVSIGESGVKAVVYSRSRIRVRDASCPLSAINQHETLMRRFTIHG